MTNFKFIYHENFDPYFNIACEEYLLKQTDGFYIRLYKNEPSVIIGSNQNTLQEVNLKECKNLGVKVVRRLTGGGAVYHDLSNVNYSIIAPYNALDGSFNSFCAPIIEYLNSIGVKAEFSGRNDITVDGKKVSGNAQTVYKNRILHHGTLLFDVDLNTLEKVLIPNEIKVKAKGVKSVRARVCNVKEYAKNVSAESFFNGLVNFLKKDLPTYNLTEKDVLKINELVKQKYSTYEWNVGASLKGSNKIDLRCSFGTLSLSFDLVGGLIDNAELYGDFFGDGVLEFIKNLNGKRFLKEDFLCALDGIERYIKGANKEEIISKLF